MRTASRPALRALALAGLLPIATGRLGAQERRRVDPSAADLAIARGRVDIAEAELYAAVRHTPREPSARGALGGFLASRGQLAAGAVLLEESRQFGADAVAVDQRLSHVYAWLGRWRAVAALAAPPFGTMERRRAEWLALHADTSRRGADSSTVVLEPNDLYGLGRIAIGVGDTTLEADIDPLAEGLVLPPMMRLLAATQLFGTTDSATIAVVYRAFIGRIAIENVPARFEAGARPRIGLDVLGPLVPTFDVRERRLTLGRPGAVPPEGGREMPFLLGFPGLRIFARRGQPPDDVLSPAGRAALRGVRWTFDEQRGVVVVAER